MGDVVNLNGLPIDADQRRELIVDLARFAEGGILTEAQVKKRWRFSEEVWQKLGDDDALVELVEAEKTRRIRSGASKREKAQLLVVKAPEVAASIMNDPAANSRHRLDACKVLDDFSATGPAAVAAAERFIISIQIGDITEHYDKPFAVGVDDPHESKPVIEHVRTSPVITTGGEPAGSTTAATTKRPRGRPRKGTPIEPIATTPKRPRGRPRKIQPEGEGDAGAV